MEYCQFLGSKWGEDANLGDVVIETSDGVRDSLNKQIDKYSDRKPDVYRTEVNFYEDRKAGEVFNKDGHIKARALICNLYNDKKVRDFLIDAVTSEIFNLEEKAKKEGYNNTRLTVYHDGRIEPVPNQIYAYLDDLPHDDLDKLIKTSKNTIDEYCL